MLSYFGDPDVNRVSFLRGDDTFMQKALAFPSSVFVPFVEGSALHTHGADGKSTHLVTATFESAPESLQQTIRNCAAVLNTPAGRVSELHVSLTFLGLHQDVKLHANQLEYSRNGEKYNGTPFFAINYLDAKAAPEFPGATPLGFMDAFAISSHDAALFSHAKMYIDWLARTRHCTGCGYYVYPQEGGTKVTCGNPDKNIKCPVRDARVSNFCFPRTDPISIVACVDAELTKVCLARSKRQIDDKHAFYSCVAGFMEPGETVEAACVRELWEETGVQCLPQDVQLLGSQPWPYPANLMIGCLATVHFDGSNESVSLNHDPELMDARWFDIKELCTAIDEHKEGFFMPFAGEFYLPGAQAIAYDILKYVADLYKSKNGAN
ncbi:NAD(+) diphosphatase [Maudiozyma humilis]|uniref:NAD(+) diphosphatase n=1 Tax=Maudiozyma humilis TaxID=51915 RepID=A0AAV5RUW7_MAUHU|nr:NAD(+) diphosphatase [Kazachstania humilis]